MTWQPLLLSLQVATIATGFAVVIGTVLAIVVTWKRLPLPNLVGAIISTPLVLPPTVLGYYLLVALGPGSVIGRAYRWLFDVDIVFTFTAAVIAATVGSVPFVVGAVRVAASGRSSARAGVGWAGAASGGVSSVVERAGHHLGR